MITVLRDALDLDVTFFDTAEVYGPYVSAAFDQLTGVRTEVPKPV
jgi:aryl-alcohol dehydrogenase-like predicted oxidoreductase